MLIKQEGKFGEGYTPISEIDGKHSEMLMDFGILNISAGKTEINNDSKERAYLLMSGKIVFEWAGKRYEAERRSLLEENPTVLQLPKDMEVKITAESDAELAVQKALNDNSFEPVLYKADEVISAEFGKGTMQETSTRTVRTVFDAANAPFSAMVMGEVINHPGKWSSYPPHDHPQPEIYHFRFFPQQGWGFSGLEDDAFVVKDRYSVTITPGKTHSQTSAPGYAMYYIWIIPHLGEDKFGPDSRNFRDEHKWLLDADAKIWPDVKVD